MMQRRTVTSGPVVADTEPSRSTTTPPSVVAGLRKNRRKGIGAVASCQYRVARLIEEDGLFLLFVVIMGCILILLIVAVSLKLTSVLFEEDDHPVVAPGRRFGRSRNPLFGSPSKSHRHSIVGMKDDDGTDAQDHDKLPFHPIYRIPEAMETVGDRSASYAKLRQQYDTELLPLNPARSMAFVESLTFDITPGAKPIPSPTVHHSDQVDSDKGMQISYDIYNCPHNPPAGYPFEWNLVNDVLGNWPADETVNIPAQIHQGLCVFDYQKDYAKAMNYRNLEQPFVVVNDPEVARTVERWHQPGYVEQMVGPNVKHRTEYNTNNHFLYAMPPPGSQRRVRGAQHKAHLDTNIQDLYGRKAELQNKQAVPQAMRMTYGEWLSHANVTDHVVSPNDEHWYFRLIGCGYMGSDGSCDHGSTEALYDELPFFQPKPSLYIGDAEEQKGIHCRFGMQGVIAENHFDGSRNAIAVLYGRRRYILAHPNQCPNLALLPKEHASARHSAVDYTHPDLATYPEFAQATSNEVVLQPGQVLYLPTNWFHFIVSLELNMQCNTRSGITDHYMQAIHDCGF